MFLAASFSLFSLLVFRPLVRGGERPGVSEDFSEPEEVFMEARMNLSGLEDPFSDDWTFPLSAGETSFCGISSITGTLSASSWPGSAAIGTLEVSVASSTEGAEGPGGTSICSGSSVYAA